MKSSYNLRPDLTLDEALEALSVLGRRALDWQVNDTFTSFEYFAVGRTGDTENALDLLGVDRKKMALYGVTDDEGHPFFDMTDLISDIQNKFKVQIVFCPELPIDDDAPVGTFRVKGPLARACRVCGCTDDFGCDGGCYWVEDDLCSECVEAENGGSA